VLIFGKVFGPILHSFYTVLDFSYSVRAGVLRCASNWVESAINKLPGISRTSAICLRFSASRDGVRDEAAVDAKQ